VYHWLDVSTTTPDSGTTSGRSPAPERRFARLRGLDRNVAALGIVSLVADLSSEMVYPLFPVFVTTVLAAPVAALGVIEGVAEATASLTRYPFGWASDTTGRRRAFVFSGYGLSTLGKLLLALAYAWPMALAGRFVDRAGKGVRTAPRDALLAAGVPEKDRGLAFGLHRTLDTLGAVLGPLVALLLVDLGLSIRAVLAVAVLPGVASIVVIALFVRERARGALAHVAVRTCPPHRRSAGCSPARSSSQWATQATSSSSCGHSRWAMA
jgi:MFS family permease